MKQDISYLHVVRVVACMMVVGLHCLPKNTIFGLDSYFFTLVLLFTRPCVPLFLMVSGVLLLPLKSEKLTDFYKKRISRVLFPLLFWGIVYSILPYVLRVENFSQMVSNLFLVVLTFPKEMGGVLWYLYVLIGLYLIIPFISPKIFEDRKMLYMYLFIWLIASLVNSSKIYLPEILGIVPISPFDMLHYFSGYLGYLFLGYYINRFFPFVKTSYKNKLKLYIVLAAICLLSMFSIAIIMKESIIIGSEELYNVITAFLSFPVILMSGCVFIGFKEWKFNEDGWFYKIIKHLSPLTFGIYLSHLLIYWLFLDPLYKISTSPLIQIFVISSTFVGAYLLTILLSKISYSKYIIG